MGAMVSSVLDAFIPTRRERLTRDPDEVMDELLTVFGENLSLESLLGRAEGLSVIFAQQPVIILVVKDDGEIVFANDFTFDHMRWSREDMLGAKYQKFVKPEHAKDTEQAHARMYEGLLLGTFSNAWMTGDGGFRSLLWICSSWVEGKALAMAVPVDLCDVPTCVFRMDG